MKTYERLVKVDGTIDFEAMEKCFGSELVKSLKFDLKYKTVRENWDLIGYQLDANFYFIILVQKERVTQFAIDLETKKVIQRNRITRLECEEFLMLMNLM